MSRLTPERTEELYTAALELLVENGYDNLTMDQIAAKTRSSKATLYRQWGNKEGLVVEALKSIVDEPVEAPDTGSLRQDLHSMIDHSKNKPNHEVELVGAVIHACKGNADLGPIVRERIVANHRVVFDTVIARAIDRGEVEPDVPGLRFALVMLIGPALLRELVDGEPADNQYLIDYIDAVFLPALGVR